MLSWREADTIGVSTSLWWLVVTALCALLWSAWVQRAFLLHPEGPLSRLLSGWPRQWRRSLPSCYGEAAYGGFFGEPLRHIRQGLFERAGVDSGAGHALPCDFILPGGHALRSAHSGLDCVPNGIGLRLCFVDQGLELPQLPALAFQFIDTHCAFLLQFGEPRRRWSLGLWPHCFPFPIPFRPYP